MAMRVLPFSLMRSHSNISNRTPCANCSRADRFAAEKKEASWNVPLVCSFCLRLSPEVVHMTQTVISTRDDYYEYDRSRAVVPTGIVRSAKGWRIRQLKWGTLYGRRHMNEKLTNIEYPHRVASP